MVVSSGSIEAHVWGEEDASLLETGLWDSLAFRMQSAPCLMEGEIQVETIPRQWETLL